MKIIATIVLALVVLITAWFCFWLSICAAGGNGAAAGDRGFWALLDLIDLAIMVGAVLLVAKLHKKQ